MQPTREQLREIIANMPNWDNLETLFAYVICHWEHIKEREKLKQHYEEETKGKEEDVSVFMDRCIWNCIVSPEVVKMDPIGHAIKDHFNAPVKCKEIYVNGEKVK